MFHALITFASEVAGEEEPSKAAFYIAGGLLAGWAVLLSLFGILRGDDFPGSEGASRGIVAFTFLLVLGAMATAVATG